MSGPIKKFIDLPNIVLVMTDQHAARALGSAGDSAADTPALDRLALLGTRFTNTYCPSPLCVPSRMAFLTGLEPHQSGVFSNDDFLRSDIPTIAHALAAGGYDCSLVGRMHFYGPDQLHGFTGRPIGDIGPGWPGAGAPDIGPLTPARGNHGREVGGSGCGETSYQAYDTAVSQTAVSTLEQLMQSRDETGQPFFALVSLFCPHPPYIALPEDYDAVADRVSMPRLRPPETRHPALAEWAQAGEVDRIDAAAIKRARTAYYGLVRMIDRLTGHVMDAVGDRDDTVVIYISDHGEALGERGLWWKSTFYDESAKVPMIMAGPGIKAGQVDHRVTSLFDLSKTILDLAGSAPLPGHVGQSLISENPWEMRAVSSYYGGLMNIATGPQRHRMLRRGDWKLCAYDGYQPQLFDLSEDPDELRDMAGDQPEIVADMMHELTMGWDVKVIARAQHQAEERNHLIRSWVKATKPEERLRWRDPAPTRNRYL